MARHGDGAIGIGFYGLAWGQAGGDYAVKQRLQLGHAIGGAAIIGGGFQHRQEFTQIGRGGRRQAGQAKQLEVFFAQRLGQGRGHRILGPQCNQLLHRVGGIYRLLQLGGCYRRVIAIIGLAGQIIEQRGHSRGLAGAFGIDIGGVLNAQRRRRQQIGLVFGAALVFEFEFNGALGQVVFHLLLRCIGIGGIAQGGGDLFNGGLLIAVILLVQPRHHRQDLAIFLGFGHIAIGIVKGRVKDVQRRHSVYIAQAKGIGGGFVGIVDLRVAQAAFGDGAILAQPGVTRGNGGDGVDIQVDQCVAIALGLAGAHAHQLRGQVTRQAGGLVAVIVGLVTIAQNGDHRGIGAL